MDKWNTQFILVMLCFMRGTEIVRVEGLWLVNRPNCSVSENPDNSPKVCVYSPFIVPSQNSMRDHCDIISWCQDCLLWSFSGKTTAHMHRKHYSSSVHLLVSTPESLVTIDASEPLHLFLNRISCLWYIIYIYIIYIYIYIYIYIIKYIYIDR